MPISTISDFIQLYSTGIISRECLEHEIRSWTDADEAQDRTPETEGCIVLYPDASGIWRAPA